MATTTVQHPPPMVIDRFKGEWRFLSNFVFCPWVDVDGVRYLTVEHAFQASKTHSVRHREMIRAITLPVQARVAGNTVPLREDWEAIKNDVMLQLLRQKFRAGVYPNYRAGLLRTGDAVLVEGTTWGDTYWGVDVKTGVGTNWLGALLMQVRGEIRAELDAQETT